MSLSVRTYEANNAFGPIDEFFVNPVTETVMDLLRKLRASPKLYNKHARVGMRLLTYYDHEPGGALINDMERDPAVLTKTLDELRRAGVLQYENDGTRLHILVDGCRDEHEAAEYTLEQSWRMEFTLSSLARENDLLKSERDHFLRTAAAMANNAAESTTPDPNPAETFITTLCMEAAAEGKTATLRMLQQQLPSTAYANGKILNVGNLRERETARTVLHSSAEKGHTEAVRAFVTELGSDVKAMDNDGSTPLHLAALNGHAETVRVLVTELGSDVKAMDNDGSTALHNAALNGHAETVRALVTELGSDVKVMDNNGYTPLHDAASQGHTPTVRVLVTELGSDVKATASYGSTPLHLSALNGHPETVRALVSELGSDLKAVDNYGYTPLHLAASGGHTETVRALIAELGSDVKAVDKSGYTPLHNAASGGHTETVRALVADLGSDVNAVDSYGDTPLHLAASIARTSTVRALVTELGADPMAKDCVGRTPRDLWRTNCSWPL